MNMYDFYRPFLIHFRTRRMRMFQELFVVTPDTDVLDVGGNLFNWRLLQDRPRLTIVNVYEPGPDDLDGECVTWVVGDARNLPFADKQFDVVYSNSVIEHLGDLPSQQAFAEEVARVGAGYFVQTPNRRFPIEPHYIAPLIHLLPPRWQMRLIRNFTLKGLLTRPTQEQCDEWVREVRLLDYRTLRQLFPDARIYPERVMGLTKSFVVVRSACDGDAPSCKAARSHLRETQGSAQALPRG
ncbi:MAG: class I SAM-dependent methyltransferase [Chloroflexota bacterium]|nr:class I SAM-dependent methyltransferase [Chloroflexota bacterium]